MTADADAGQRRRRLGDLMVSPFGSVRAATVFWVLVVVVISLFLSTWHTIHGQRDRLYTELQTRANIVADSYARALQRPMWDIDRKGAREIVRAIYEADKAVVGAWLYDEHFGEVTAAFGPQAETERPGPDFLTVTRKITFPEAEAPLGELHIVYSYEAVHSFVRQAWLTGLVKFLIVAAAMSFVLLFLLNRFTTPLINLTETLNRLAQGELAIEIGYEHRPDEVGRMARACRAFKESLQDKIRIEQDARAFEKRKSEERTAELEALAQYIEATFSGMADDLAARGRSLQSYGESLKASGAIDADTAADLASIGDRLVNDGGDLSDELGYILDMLRGS